MKLATGFLAFAISLGCFFSSSKAAVVLTFDAVPTFTADTGIQSINVFANSTLLAGEVGAVLGADFALGGGAVFNSPNAGTFGGTGFVGNGNINIGASSFDRDTTPALANTGYLNITFANFAQTVANVRAPIATLLVSTNGLAPGNYSISVSNGFFGGDVIADTSSSFNVTAVPEPSSLLLLGLCSAGVYYRHRRSSLAAAA